MEKYEESLAKAEKYLKTADHLTYITFPLIKEKRLLLKILEEIGLSLIHSINASLQYEYLYKKIQLYSSARDNFQTFRQISPKYSISLEELNRITNILAITEKHKKSPLEFVKNEKVIIMSDGMSAETVTHEKIKKFLIDTKEFSKKISTSLKNLK